MLLGLQRQRKRRTIIFLPIHPDLAPVDCRSPVTMECDLFRGFFVLPYIGRKGRRAMKRLPILFCLLVGLAGTVRAEEKSVEELFRLAAAVPGAIQRGEYRVKSHFQRFEPSKKELNIDFGFVFDGDKVRIQRNYNGRETVYCSIYKKNVDRLFVFESAPYNLTVHESKFPDLAEPNFASLFLYEKKNYKKLSIREFTEDRYAVNPRSMGYVQSGIADQSVPCSDLDVYLSRYLDRHKGGMRIDIAYGRENYKGSDCIKVTIIRDDKDAFIKEMLRLKKAGMLTNSDADGNPQPLPSDEELAEIIRKRETSARRDFYFDPAKGHALRYEEVNGNFPKTRAVLENDLKRDAASGLWYPSHWFYENYMGSRLQYREENTLEAVSLNKRIDPAVFSPASIEGLKPGTPVQWNLDTPPPGEGKLIWDGNDVVSPLHSARPASPLARLLRIVFILAGIVMIGFGLVSKWRGTKAGKPS